MLRVGAYIGAAYFFTSSTSFANSAISLGLIVSNTFAGIAPAAVPAYIAAQLIGGAVAIGILRVLYPDVTPEVARRGGPAHPHERAAAEEREVAATSVDRPTQEVPR